SLHSLHSLLYSFTPLLIAHHSPLTTYYLFLDIYHERNIDPQSKFDLLRNNTGPAPK
ncbi:MAG: hypothetical protein ACI9X4_001861, partial [Glaciecola sp.]